MLARWRATAGFRQPLEPPTLRICWRGVGSGAPALAGRRAVPAVAGPGLLVRRLWRAPAGFRQPRRCRYCPGQLLGRGLSGNGGDRDGRRHSGSARAALTRTRSPLQRRQPQAGQVPPRRRLREPSVGGGPQTRGHQADSRFFQARDDFGKRRLKGLRS